MMLPVWRILHSTHIVHVPSRSTQHPTWSTHLMTRIRSWKALSTLDLFFALVSTYDIWIARKRGYTHTCTHKPHINSSPNTYTLSSNHSHLLFTHHPSHPTNICTYVRHSLPSLPSPLLPSHIYPLTLLPSPLTYTPTYVPLAVERGSFPLALTLLSRTPSLTCCQPLSLETQVYMDRTHVHTVQYVEEEEEPTLLVS